MSFKEGSEERAEYLANEKKEAILLIGNNMKEGPTLRTNGTILQTFMHRLYNNPMRSPTEINETAHGRAVQKMQNFFIKHLELKNQPHSADWSKNSTTI